MFEFLCFSTHLDLFALYVRSTTTKRGHSHTKLIRFCPCWHNPLTVKYKVKSLYIIDISSTTYLPSLVDVVKECPLICLGCVFCHPIWTNLYMFRLFFHLSCQNKTLRFFTFSIKKKLGLRFKTPPGLLEFDALFFFNFQYET